MTTKIIKLRQAETSAVTSHSVVSIPNLQVLTVGLASLRYGISAASQTHYMMAGAVLSMLPMLVAYVVANKSFMQMTAGSFKG